MLSLARAFYAKKTVINMLLQGDELLIDGVAFEQVLTEDVGSPNAELGTPLALDSIAHGDDYIKVVVCYLSFYGTIALLLNCQVFLDC